MILNKHLLVRKNLSERIPKIILTTDDKIRNKKLQHDISRGASEAAALSSNKTEKKEYRTGE